MIDRYRTLGAVVAVVLVASLAGCATLPESGSYEVDFDGPVERTDGEFHMEGTVEIDSTTAETRNFSNVTVVFYDEDRSVIDRVRLGPMSTDSENHPSDRYVDVTLSEPPAYVVIDSPDFWDGNVAVTAYRWNGERYVGDHFEQRDAVFEQGSS